MGYSHSHLQEDVPSHGGIKHHGSEDKCLVVYQYLYAD